jgi:hypothetical protein
MKVSQRAHGTSRFQEWLTDFRGILSNRPSDNLPIQDRHLYSGI